MLSNFLFLQLPSSHLPLYLRRYFELRPLRCSFIQPSAVHVVYCVSIFRFSKSSSSFSFPSRYLGIDPDLDFKGNLLSIPLDIYSFPPPPPPSFPPLFIVHHSSSITYLQPTLFLLVVPGCLVCCPSGFSRFSKFGSCTRAVLVTILSLCALFCLRLYSIVSIIIFFFSYLRLPCELVWL